MATIRQIVRIWIGRMIATLLVALSGLDDEKSPETPGLTKQPSCRNPDYQATMAGCGIFTDVRPARRRTEDWVGDAIWWFVLLSSGCVHLINIHHEFSLDLASRFISRQDNALSSLFRLYSFYSSSSLFSSQWLFTLLLLRPVLLIRLSLLSFLTNSYKLATSLPLFVCLRSLLNQSLPQSQRSEPICRPSGTSILSQMTRIFSNNQSSWTRLQRSFLTRIQRTMIISQCQMRMKMMTLKYRSSR